MKRNDAVIVVYKLGCRMTRVNGELTPTQIINGFLKEAAENNGRVLFTTDKGPADWRQDHLKTIILTTRSGNKAAVGNVVKIGAFDCGNPPEGYEMPSVYREDKGEM